MKIKYIFSIIFILSVLLFLSHRFITKTSVYGDGRYYYSFVRSAVLDHDLDFENEFQYFGIQIKYSSKGKVENKFSIGTAIFYLPFFLISHLAFSTLKIFGAKVLANGYSWPYEVSSGIGAIFYSSIGLLLCFKSLSLFFSKKTSTLAVLFIWLATNLFFYTTLDVINSHVVSFFSSALFIYYLLINRKNLSQKKYFIAGMLLSLTALTRLQDLIFGIFPLLFLFVQKIKLKEKIVNLISLGIGFFLIFSLQLAIWKYLFGSIVSPYLILGEKFVFNNHHFLDVLFSNKNGLFYYSPILLLAILGIVLFLGDNALIAVNGILIFILQFLIVSFWHDWWGGEAYGQRMFISLMPFFMLGFAKVIQKVKSLSLAVFISLGFVIINFGSIIFFMFKK